MVVTPSFRWISLQLDLHRGAQVLVERGKGLVEQQHLAVDHQRAGQRDALLLAAGELPGPAVLEAASLTRASVSATRRAISALGSRRAS